MQPRLQVSKALRDKEVLGISLGKDQGADYGWATVHLYHKNAVSKHHRLIMSISPAVDMDPLHTRLLYSQVTSGRLQCASYTMGSALGNLKEQHMNVRLALRYCHQQFAYLSVCRQSVCIHRRLCSCHSRLVDYERFSWSFPWGQKVVFNCSCCPAFFGFHLEAQNACTIGAGWWVV